jgi:O-antigen/teichoic acid export membrane protein
LADTLFDGNSTYVGLLSAVAVAFAVIYLGRGIFAGHRRFGRYSTLLAGEGLVRLAVATSLVLLGVASGPALAAAVPIGAWLAAAATLALAFNLVRPRPSSPSVGDVAGASMQGSLIPRPSTRGTRGVAANFGSLLVASLASQGLNNAGPLTAQALGDDPALTGGLLAAFILVRVPVMFISALQSGFIPSLVEAVRSGEETRFHALLRGVLLRVSGVGALAVVGAGIAGPFVVRLFFGPDYQLEGVDFAVLTLATVAFVLASILQAALVALDRHRVVAVAWVIGLVLYGCALLLPLPLLRQVELGYLIGTFGVCLLLAGGLELSSGSRRRERAVARGGTP